MCATCSNVSVAADTIAIWFANTTVDPATMARYRSMLSEEERNAIGRYHFLHDRNLHTISRANLREVLSAYLQIAPEALAFEHTAFGKPYLASAQNHRDLHFNMSHSGTLIVYAVAQGREVGVDVEHIRDFADCLEVARNFFTPAEWRMLADLKGENRNREFFHLWTRKEAYIKARGMGLSMPINTFEVGTATGPIRLMEPRPNGASSRAWMLSDLDVPIGYCGAFVTADENLKVEYRIWPPNAMEANAMS